jgi:hypothetical protein
MVFHAFRRKNLRLIANQLHFGPDLKYDLAHGVLSITGKRIGLGAGREVTVRGTFIPGGTPPVFPVRAVGAPEPPQPGK